MTKKSNSIDDVLAQSPSVDKVGVEERTTRFQTRSIKNEAKWQGLNMVLNMIDLTTLEGKDTPGKVRQMCYKAQHLHDLQPGLPTVAAVCVYPSMVGFAKKALGKSNINVASVATAFPSGQSSLEVKLLDTKLALDNGADEIDMVISRGAFLSGEYTKVYDEIAQIKEVCGTAHLKVILEKYLIKDQTDNWIKLFTKMNIPCGPIYNIKQAVENPQITFRNMIVSSDHKKIGKFKMAGNPIKMSNYKDPKTRGEIPELDQHRKKILKDFKIKI